MSAPDLPGTHVLSAILDGTQVAWPAGEEVDEEERQMLAALKLIADVVEFHRDLQHPSLSRVTADPEQATRVQQWGHLQVLERVGRGSFGAVYRAWDMRLDREVALKLIPAAHPAESDRASLIHEGRLLARVRHPNVVAIYGAEQIGNQIGLWMEFVHGRTLEQALNEGRTFSVAEAIDIGIELCRAVGAVHDAGLLHRDIKAQNVAVTDEGRVVLMDFGAGRDLAESPDSDLTGTPLYLAPEALAGGPASVRSDVYSVGVLLYHLITGSYPVPRRSLEEIRRSHEEGKRVSLLALRPHLPDRFVSIVERALAKDAEARYATVHEMAIALIAVRDRLTPRARARGPSLLVAGALAGAIVLLIWWSAPGRSRGAPVSEPGDWMQITRFGDSATAPALSPDGRTLVFIRGSNPFFGPGQIYVKNLPDGEPERVTDDDLAKMSPVFSPDGSQIAYTTVDTRTFRWDTQVVAVGDSTPPRTLVNASGLTWIGERRYLFSEIRKGVHMVLVTATDGAAKPRDVYVPPHERGMVHRSALSPDGRWVLAVEMENQLWLPCRLLPFDGIGPGTPVGPPGAACTAAAWSPDGAWMYLNSNAGGSFHIWRQRFPDGPPMQLTTGPTEEHGIALAPDGRSLFTSIGITNSTVWVRDARGVRQVSTEGNASLPGVEPSAALPRGTYFSPDRQKLYYLVRRGGGATFLDGELWAADLESGRTRAMLPGFTLASFDVSSDGRRVVFAAADANGRPRLWIASLDGTTQPRQLSTGDDDHPVFGPAGDVFFRSSHDGANFLYRMNPDGTGRERIAEMPILALHSVSPDGRWVVAYTAVADPDVSVAAVAHSTTRGTARRVCNQCKVSWSQTGSHVYISFAWHGGRTYVIAVQPDESWPALPARGIRSEADLSALPVVREIEELSSAPADDGFVHAFTRVGVQRNLYRIPVP